MNRNKPTQNLSGTKNPIITNRGFFKKKIQFLTNFSFPKMEHIKLNVLGMTCSSCTSSVTNVLSQIPGISNVNVELLLETATMDASIPASSTLSTLEQACVNAVEDAGFTVSIFQSISTLENIVEFDIIGMTCMVFFPFPIITRLFF